MRWLTFYPIVCCLAACSKPPTPARSEFVISDSSGILIAINPTPLEQLPTWTIDSQATAVIGRDSVGPGYIRQVGFGYRLSNGAILTGDGVFTPEVLLFDSTGRFVRVVCRKGGGPGEVLGPTQPVLLDSSTIAIYDEFQSRAIILDGDAKVLATIPIHGRSANPGTVEGLSGSVHLIERTGGLAIIGSSATCRGFGCRNGAAIVRFSGQSPNPDTLFMVRAEETDGEGIMIFLGARSALAVRLGSIAYMDGALAEIAVHDFTGRLRRLIRWPAQHHEYTSDDLAEGRKQYSGQRVTFAKVAPEASGILYGSDGELWVERNIGFHGEERSFFVFDSTGRALGQAVIPRGTFPLQFGHDFVLLVTSDVDGASLLEVRRLVRTPSRREAHDANGGSGSAEHVRPIQAAGA